MSSSLANLADTRCLSIKLGLEGWRRVTGVSDYLVHEGVVDHRVSGLDSAEVLLGASVGSSKNVKRKRLGVNGINGCDCISRVVEGDHRDDRAKHLRLKQRACLWFREALAPKIHHRGWNVSSPKAQKVGASHARGKRTGG